MTNDELYTSLSTNTIMAKLTNQFQRTRIITSSPEKHNSLDSEDDFLQVVEMLVTTVLFGTTLTQMITLQYMNKELVLSSKQNYTGF